MLECVCLIDPERPPADVHHQPEGGEFYRGEERCSQSNCSVSVHIYSYFI